MEDQQYNKNVPISIKRSETDGRYAPKSIHKLLRYTYRQSCVGVSVSLITTTSPVHKKVPAEIRPPLVSVCYCNHRNYQYA